MNYKLLTIVISVMIVMMLLAFIISYYKALNIVPRALYAEPSEENSQKMRLQERSEAKKDN